jgi:peptidoglycan hydrolase-like protein with peptidoglycan-binding domain
VSRFLVLLAAGVMLASPAAAEAATFGERPLQRGSHGHDVRVLQKWLTNLGFATAVDGEYGPSTVRSVRRFERKRGLGVDGRISVADAQLLRGVVEGGALAQQAPATASPTGKATATADGHTATAPSGAPAAVQQAIAAANRITDTPYRWGGGHGRWEDSGYDCSGAVSYALHGAGLLDETLDSSGLEDFGAAGAGQWITVYANSGHAFVVIAGLRFDTSGAGESGPRWRAEARSGNGYVVRHPAGL